MPLAGAAGTVLIAPERLVVAERPGGCGALKAQALALRQGPSGVELYASLRNAGDGPACGAAFSAELFDASDQSLAAGVGGLLVTRFFRLADGAERAACIAPGDTSLVSLRDLRPGLAPEDVSRVEYWCNYWALDVVPIGKLEVNDVATVQSSGGVSFTGVLINHLDLPLPAPAVAVFPLDDAGRPLGVALAQGTEELTGGGSWSFVTDAVSDAGASRVAFPTRGP